MGTLASGVPAGLQFFWSAPDALEQGWGHSHRVSPLGFSFVGTGMGTLASGVPTGQTLKQPGHQGCMGALNEGGENQAQDCHQLHEDIERRA